MWVWSKLSGAQWEDAWEERFYGNPNAVLSHLKGGKSLRVEVYCESREEADQIAEQFGGSVKKLADKNWVALSAKAGPPIKIRDSLVITEEKAPAKLRELQREFPGREVVSIPPEMAFGTGDHPTTAGCLRHLADEAKARKRARWRFLDLGCGSGVLAIAASLLGAEECDALDYDPNAVVVAERNVERNGARGVRVMEADVLEWEAPRQYEVVAANLFSEVLKAAFPRIRGMVASGGRLILSGVLRTQWDETRAAAEEAGFTVLEHGGRGKWTTARCGLRE